MESPELTATRGSADEPVGFSYRAMTLISFPGIVQGRAANHPGTCRAGANPADQKGKPDQGGIVIPSKPVNGLLKAVHGDHVSRHWLRTTA